ncbi:MAG: lysozyme M1 (1,4-beta-N-acetylmuramidase) [Actinomycetia bacterium]|nr:lysozyme M1 (1,4-beta-N-acetylmuramidase) [Actinomycetes bacterium]
MALRTKLLLAVGAIVVVLVGAAALGWFVWAPSWRPTLEAGEVYGVDVSHHQGVVNWQDVHSDGIQFAYLKATEGGDHVDGSFEANWEGATAAGLDVGAYHFFTLCTTGREQADNFLAELPEGGAGMPPAVDLEVGGNCASRPPQWWLHQELAVFLTTVSRSTGQDVLLYVGDAFDDLYSVTGEFSEGLWQRRILRRPDTNRWVVWQASYFAAVNGIDGRVDLDVRRGG